MIEISNLNKTIAILEKEVNNITTISSVINQIDKMKVEISSQSESFYKCIENIDNTRIELDKSNEIFIKKIDEMESRTIHLDKIIKDHFASMTEEHNKQNRELNLKIQKIEEITLDQIQTIKNENKRMNLELEQLFNSKLERMKSDIELEFRNSTKIIQNDFESSLSNIQKIFDLKMDVLISENKKIHRFSIISILSITLFGVLNLIFLFMK